MAVDRFEDPTCQPPGFPQMTELQQRGRIGDRLPGQIDPHETTDRLAVVDCFLDPLVREPEALLRYIHAQDPFETD